MKKQTKEKRYKILGIDMVEDTMQFRGWYSFLSNFYASEIRLFGLMFPTAENAYQAAKCVTDFDRLQFTYLSPVDAKKVGRMIDIRPDWEKIKIDCMYQVIREKFKDHTLANQLIGTGDQILVEGNYWGDTFWGVDLKTGRGENHLGKILMRVREEVKNEKA